eukprot:scaffold86245_cov19-Tisochrysis_lutea.AAC.1
MKCTCGCLLRNTWCEQKEEGVGLDWRGVFKIASGQLEVGLDLIGTLRDKRYRSTAYPGIHKTDQAHARAHAGSSLGAHVQMRMILRRSAWLLLTQAIRAQTQTQN